MSRAETIKNRRREVIERAKESLEGPMTTGLPPAGDESVRLMAVIDNMTREGVLAPERVIGNPDFLKISFIYRAVDRSAAVGRVALRHADGELEGFATGFLIGPGLMMTNHHVFESANETADCVLQMVYEDGSPPRGLRPATFPIRALDGNGLFHANKELDMAICSLATTSLEGIPLSAYGWIQIEGQRGKVDLGWPVNLIQHPDAGKKQLVIRNNRVTRLDHPTMLVYEADTLPGSSGSPVFNDMWQLVALHSV